VEKLMSFNFSNDTPIYFQIAELIKVKIINGSYGLGEKLPAIRELSASLKANPNTVQKALLELEDLGLIYTERTNGKYVTTDKNLILGLKKQIIDSKTNSFITELKELGLSAVEIKEYLNSKEDLK
jgi:DNA-binding transcriptional regulator YhcF (GntR family)